MPSIPVLGLLGFSPPDVAPEACSLAPIPSAVPRAGDLPLASFRFHLAVKTLVLSYGYCSGLSP